MISRAGPGGIAGLAHLGLSPVTDIVSNSGGAQLLAKPWTGMREVGRRWLRSLCVSESHGRCKTRGYRGGKETVGKGLPAQRATLINGNVIPRLCGVHLLPAKINLWQILDYEKGDYHGNLW